MLARFKKFYVLSRFLAALFVFGAITSAGAAESHRSAGASDHAGHRSAGDGGAVETGGLAQAPAPHDGDHANHCMFDALCVSGAWSLSGQDAVVPPVRATAVRLIPRTASPDGLRPRPELRPPRQDA